MRADASTSGPTSLRQRLILSCTDVGVSDLRGRKVVEEDLEMEEVRLKQEKEEQLVVAAKLTPAT
jgi:hypothetical protein